MARLEAVLTLNGIDEVKAARAVNVFRVNPQWWGDPYQVERLSATHVTNRRDLVASLTEQYISGVQVPREVAAAYPTAEGQERQAYTLPGEGGGGNTLDTLSLKATAQ